MGLVEEEWMLMESGEGKHKIDWKSSPQATPRDPPSISSWHQLTNQVDLVSTRIRPRFPVFSNLLLDNTARVPASEKLLPPTMRVLFNCKDKW
jgi:hypothetical protein